MRPAIGFAAALRDPALLGGAFRDPSFAAWHVLAQVISGERLDFAGAALFRRCTGRRRLPRGPVNELDLVIGRRGGKSRWLSALALWTTAIAYDWRAFASPGETVVTALVGADRRQAVILARYALGLAKASPMISAQLTREAEGRLEFANGGALEVMTNDDRLIRGRSMAALLGDEVCWWKSDENGAASDEEVFGAAVPALATAPGGGWTVLSSSPGRPRGLLHRRWKAAHGRDSADEVAWQAASRVMNPTLPEAVVRKALAADPVRARAEFLAEWRQAGDDFVPADVVEAAIDLGVRERPPVPGLRYVGFIDGAGGTGADSFCSGVAHLDTDGIVIVDRLLERRPRFVPATVVAEHAAVLATYGVREVTGDAYSAAWIRDEFGRHGILYRYSRKNRSEIYLSALPMLLAGRVRLLDSQRLRDQLTSLQRSVQSSGREVVDHPPGASNHDDLALAAAGAMVLAAPRAPRFQARLIVAPRIYTRHDRGSFVDGYSDPDGGRPIDVSMGSRL